MSEKLNFYINGKTSNKLFDEKDYNFIKDNQKLQLYLSSILGNKKKYIYFTNNYLKSIENIINKYNSLTDSIDKLYILKNNIEEELNNIKEKIKKLNNIENELKKNFDIYNFINILNSFLKLFELYNFLMNNFLNKIYYMIMKFKFYITINNFNDEIMEQITIFFKKYYKLFLFK